MKSQARFRIVVGNPLPGVTYGVQRGASDLLVPLRRTPTELVFEFPLTLADIDADPPRLTGEYAQGPPKKRFVYVNSGTMAGQQGSCWTRRAKVPLHGIRRSSLREVLQRDGVLLEARIFGTSKDGGPVCATVPLLSGWTVTAEV